MVFIKNIQKKASLKDNGLLFYRIFQVNRNRTMTIKGKEQLNEKYQNRHSKETQKNTNKVLPIWSMFSIKAIPDVTKSRPSSKIQPGIPKKWRKCVAKES